MFTILEPQLGGEYLLYRYPRKPDEGELYVFSALPSDIGEKLVRLIMVASASSNPKSYMHVDYGMRLKDKYILYDEPFDEYLSREVT